MGHATRRRRWEPTFTTARHLYTEAALAWLRDPGGYDNANVLAQSVQPILDAGLGDVVDERADLGEGLRLAPTGGHTPGHVSLWIESDDQTALLTGDFFHHPVQCAVPEWAEIGDSDPDEARATRRRMLDEAARDGRARVRHALPDPGRSVASWRTAKRGASSPSEAPYARPA